MKKMICTIPLIFSLAVVGGQADQSDSSDSFDMESVGYPAGRSPFYDIDEWAYSFFPNVSLGLDSIAARFRYGNFFELVRFSNIPI
jgi:hypothetical protein